MQWRAEHLVRITEPVFEVYYLAFGHMQTYIADFQIPRVEDHFVSCTNCSLHSQRYRTGQPSLDEVHIEIEIGMCDPKFIGVSKRMVVLCRVQPTAHNFIPRPCIRTTTAETGESKHQ